MIYVAGLIVKGNYFFKDLLFSFWHSIISVYLTIVRF